MKTTHDAPNFLNTNQNIQNTLHTYTLKSAEVVSATRPGCFPQRSAFLATESRTMLCCIRSAYAEAAASW